MNKHYLAVLLISGVLLITVIPLRNMLFNSPVDVRIPPEYKPIMHIPSDVDKNHNGIARASRPRNRW